MAFCVLPNMTIQRAVPLPPFSNHERMCILTLPTLELTKDFAVHVREEMNRLFENKH